MANALAGALLDGRTLGSRDERIRAAVKADRDARRRSVLENPDPRG